VLGCLMGDVDVERVVLLCDEVVYLISLIFRVKSQARRSRVKWLLVEGRLTKFIAVSFRAL
jgi:hypothetical protein